MGFKKKKEPKFFTLAPYKNKKFIDPCKKCLVKPACTIRCKKRIDYNKTYSVKEALFFLSSFCIVVSGVGFLLGALAFSGHYILSISIVIALSFLLVHFVFLLEG